MLNFCRPETVNRSIECLAQGIRAISLLGRIPQSIIYEHKHTTDKTPMHHNNPIVESLLKEQLCDYPPYQARKSNQYYEVNYLITCIFSSSWFPRCHYGSRLQKETSCCSFLGPAHETECYTQKYYTSRRNTGIPIFDRLFLLTTSGSSECSNCFVATRQSLDTNP